VFESDQRGFASSERVTVDEVEEQPVADFFVRDRREEGLGLFLRHEGEGQFWSEGHGRLALSGSFRSANLHAFYRFRELTHEVLPEGSSSTLRSTPRSVKFAARGITALVFFLSLTALGEPTLRRLRFYNAGADERRVEWSGGEVVLLAATAADIELTDADVRQIQMPADIIAVERLPIVGSDDEETHRILARTASCAPTAAVRVPLLACRFGMAEAQVEPVAGATYQWAVDGGTIMSGNGTPSVLLGFGDATAAEVTVTVTTNGCASTGSAVLPLRDPLRVSLVVPDGNVGVPTRLTWTYNTSDPVLTQLLQLPDEPAAIRLDPSARSYSFVPKAEGTKAIRLMAALYRIGGRRRAVRTGSGPSASSCSLTELQETIHVRPACANPRAQVSGGGSGCGSVAVRADFEGTPPFRGRWSDGVSFETSSTSIQRSVAASGTYSLHSFGDAICEGTTTGTAVVTLMPQTRITALTASPSAIAWDSTTRITYSYTNADSCRFTGGVLGNSVSEQPSCSGTGSKSLTYYASNAAGNEEFALEATGPCGTDRRTLRFYVCDYHALLVAAGPTTFCAGGSVTLHVQIAGETAGPPFSEYRFYRCTTTGPGACQSVSEYSLVQRGPSSSYMATQSGSYRAETADRLGCPNIEGGSVRVNVNSCP